MIDVLPVPYKDELFYSWLARCYVKNCYPDYKTFSHQIMGRCDTNPSFEFVNKITGPELEQMKKVFPGGIKQIIDEHTLIPYYACFIEPKNKELIYLTAGQENLRFDKWLGLPNTEHTKFLKYCPICARKDREMLGEAYWHRCHQIIQIKACPIHKVCLINSNIAMNEKVRWNLFTAELEIQDVSEIKKVPEKEMVFSEYAERLLNLSISTITNNKMTVGQYLSLRMLGTKYVTARGNKRKVALLNKDLIAYWQRNIPLHKMKKVLRGLTNQTNEVVFLAILLQVPPRDLLTKEMVCNDQIRNFDEKVMNLHRNGKTVSAISNALKLSPLTINKIIEAGQMKS